MSVIIERNQDGTFFLSRDGSPINNKSYYRINRLNDNSNYYQLWPNEKCFYLYNQLNGKFARNSRTDLDADLFKDVRHYSQKTKSFAAYRSDSSQAHLIYEDGDVVKDVFIEIGSESNDDCCSRPVKYFYSGYKWGFYETSRKRFAWPKDSGYSLSDSNSLCSRFINGFFAVYNSEGNVYQLAFYDRDKLYPYVTKNTDGTKTIRQGHLHFFDNYQFDEVQSHDRYILCKDKKGVYHIFDTLAKEKVKPLCTSVDEPIISDDFIFITSEFTKQIFLIKKKKIVENDAWRKDCEIKICRDYVFVKNADENNWRIYNLQDCHEVYTDLSIVHVELARGNVSCTVNCPSGNTEVYNLDGIKQANKQWLDRITTLLNNNQEQTETSSSTVIETMPKEAAVELEFPDHIDFVISAKVNIRPQSPRVISFGRKASQLQPNNIILFYDEEKNSLFFVCYRQKTYHILYSQKFDYVLPFASSIPNSFMSCHVDGLSEENFLDKIKKVLVKEDTHRTYISIDKKQRDVTDFLKKHGFEDDVIQRALHVLLPDYFEKEEEIKKFSTVKFVFKDIEYMLRPDDEWPIDNPFDKQHFLDKKTYVAILVESNFGFKEGSEIPGAHYEMKGRGKDQKENQSYEKFDGSLNTNGIIRDNKKQILLFKRRKDNKIIFFDEVKCVSSREEREYYGDNYRIIIKFFLRSKIREI